MTTGAIIRGFRDGISVDLYDNIGDNDMKHPDRRFRGKEAVVEDLYEAFGVPAWRVTVGDESEVVGDYHLRYDVDRILCEGDGVKVRVYGRRAR